MCIHISMGDGLLACQMNSPWNFLKYQVFHLSFSSLPSLQISYTFYLYIATRKMYLSCEVRYPVFIKINGKQNVFLCSLIGNFFDVLAVCAYILNA